MKKIFLICVSLMYALMATSQATYFVATNGSDSNPGSIEQPFKTLQKISTLPLKPGDKVFIRAGTYMSGVNAGSRCWLLQNIIGTQAQPILISAYPGDFANGGRVVFDCGDYKRTQNVYGIGVTACQWLIIRGIRCTNTQQTIGAGAGNITGAWWEVSSKNCVFDNCEGDNSMTGFRADDGVNNTFNNCDAHHIDDPFTGGTTGAHNNSDGFQRTNPANPETGTIYRGCRSYWCSDDAFDMFGTPGTVTFENCWSFWTGCKPGLYPPAHVVDGVTYGDGNGFKMGGGNPAATGLIRFARKCIATGVQVNGFDQNAGYFTAQFFNNVAYNCGVNDWKFGYNPPIAHQFRNNIGYKCKIISGNSTDAAAWSPNDHNSWNGLTVTDADFQSLDDQQLIRPRKANGDLPDITFLQLAPSSKLINAGIDVGLPYTGSAPDIGAFEYAAAQTIYKNQAASGTFIRNNCPVNNTGSSVVYTVPAGKYTSTISQTDADQKAAQDINANGQTYANTNGTCTPNAAKFESNAFVKSFRKNNCSSGIGSVETYSVAAGKYTSDISQSAADQKAIAEIDANGQKNANDVGHCELNSVTADQRLYKKHHSILWKVLHWFFSGRFKG